MFSYTHVIQPLLIPKACSGNNDGIGDHESSSGTEASQTKGSTGRSFQSIDGYPASEVLTL
ncbi:hypothetical protein Pint_31480 [Pistacia integerrima]|uniref:Uncharacterized protein n=1 Tax=Pistacia integerrima TaxID=434235 RepID=A0ACC0XLJ3_9ROSI|nr:hypothetical protein Pint_31480 [Pistacia integerrima]